jgi:hypothetical protein
MTKLILWQKDLIIHASNKALKVFIGTIIKRFPQRWVIITHAYFEFNYYKLFIIFQFTYVLFIKKDIVNKNLQTNINTKLTFWRLHHSKLKTIEKILYWKLNGVSCPIDSNFQLLHRSSLVFFELLYYQLCDVMLSQVSSNMSYILVFGIHQVC